MARFQPDDKYINTYGVNPTLLETPGLYWLFEEGSMVELTPDTAFLGAGKEGPVELIERDEFMRRCKAKQEEVIEAPKINSELARLRVEAAALGLAVPKQANAKALSAMIGRKRIDTAVDA